MPYTTILADLTKADHAVTQYLMDTIREDLDYLNAERIVLAATTGYIHLGGVAGTATWGAATFMSVPQAGATAIGQPFNLPAPPTGKKWAIEFKGRASGSGAFLRMYLKTAADLEDYYVTTAALTSSLAEINMPLLYITGAYRGRLIAAAYQGPVNIQNGVARAYLVAA